MSNKIHIDDLANPILTQMQKEALAFTENMEVNFDVDTILNEAKAKLQLLDFGNPDFLRRLQLLCNEWGNDITITNLGRFSLRNKLVLYAKNRLLIQDTLKKHPEILNEKIEKPIIVCGLPRSGTTHLLNLLAADSRLRSLPLWESYEPIANPLETIKASNVDPRYSDPRYWRCSKQWEMMQQMTPYLAAMHPMNPDHIHEELELMGPDFASYNFEWLAMSPHWRDDYYQHDQTPHYEYMRDVLKILQWQDRQQGKSKQRWVLKCPQHLEQLPVLEKVFPDATIVITHRDPVAVIQSTITMLAYGQRINRKKVQMQELLQYWTDRIEHLLRACVNDRANLSLEKSLDVPFNYFMANDIDVVRSIYQKANLEITAQTESEIKDYIDAHPRGKDGQIVYDLEKDFGVSADKLRQRFQFYFDAFPLL